MAEASSGELYGNKLIRMLEIVWGDGYLSPGGPEEVGRVLAGLDLTGRSVLDMAAARAESISSWSGSMAPDM